jgi:hypothetical protein
MGSNNELAQRLLKQGLAKTLLDAQRLADSMSNAKPFEPDVAQRAEKYWDKNARNVTDLNIRTNRFAPTQQAPSIQPVQTFTSIPSASEVSATESEVARLKVVVEQLQKDVELLKQKVGFRIEQS